jgi:hypothetical protein
MYVAASAQHLIVRTGPSMDDGTMARSRAFNVPMAAVHALNYPGVVASQPLFSLEVARASSRARVRAAFSHAWREHLLGHGAEHAGARPSAARPAREQGPLSLRARLGDPFSLKLTTRPQYHNPADHSPMASGGGLPGGLGGGSGSSANFQYIGAGALRTQARHSMNTRTRGTRRCFS